jgi:hypothetical protein
MACSPAASQEERSMGSVQTSDIRCPHCGRTPSLQLRDASLWKPHVARQEHFVVCECTALFVLRRTVRFQALPLVAVQPDRIGVKAAARRIARVVRANRGAARPREVSCPGCYGKFGGTRGYPDPLPAEGLCAVCCQEYKRLGAAPRAGGPA